MRSGYSEPPGGEKRSTSPLLQRVRELTRCRHMSIRTEEAYVGWIDKFLRFHRDRNQDREWRRPEEMGNNEVNQFLTHLAVERKVAACT